MSNLKLSIIIPVYNVEKYVEKCIRSCENQDIPKEDYEVIVVNDGSPDGSLAVVERLAEEYSNIKVISQENQGLSGARNTGLDVAHGEYIWFVDSDDWIDENCLGRITAHLKDGLDVFNIQYRNVFQDKTESQDIVNYFDGVKSGEEVLCRWLFHTAAQFSIYRRAFLRDNNLKFMVGILHEDVEFKPRAICLAKSVKADKVVSYNYLQRSSGNITASYSVKRAKDLLTANRSLYDFSKDKSSQLIRFFNQRIGMSMNSIFSGYHSLNVDDQKLVRNLLNENQDFFKCMIKSGNKKYMIEGIVLMMNVNLGLKLHSLIRCS